MYREMWIVGLCLLFLLSEEALGTNDCSQQETDGNRLHKINCMLLKRFTFNPWAGKRSSELTNIDTIEPTRYDRDFSSWGGKRITSNEMQTENVENVPKTKVVLNCMQRFIHDPFLVAQCIKVLQKSCNLGSADCDKSEMARREFSAWGGWRFDWMNQRVQMNAPEPVCTDLSLPETDHLRKN